MEQLGARRAHNPKVTGSSPVPATKERKSSEMVTFFVLHLSQTYIYIVIKVEFKLNSQVRYVHFWERIF